MNLIQPSRCVIRNWLTSRLPSSVTPLTSSPLSSTSSRKISSTICRKGRQKRVPYSRVRGEDKKTLDEVVKGFQPYTEEEKQALAQKHTPEQIGAIEAGEAAVDPRDLATQASVRTDPMRLKYSEDLSAVDPVLDKPSRPPPGTTETRIAWRDDNEIVSEYVKQATARLESMEDKMAREGPIEDGCDFDEHLLEFGDEDLNYLHASNPSAIKVRDGVLAAELPKVDKPTNIIGSSNNIGEDDGARLLRLMQQTGLDLAGIKRLRIKTLISRRVVNQTRLGKVASQYYLTIAGNQNGLLGIGEGKAIESSDARRQAMMAAIKNMKPIPRYENRTIYGEVESKVGAVELKLTSRPPGKRFLK